jgi:hypothetical protein
MTVSTGRGSIEAVVSPRLLPVVPAAAALLLWPALWNGYPIVFADTGTYLSQAVHRYAGWDRPVFYSLFMLALHWTVTLWPVVIAQALLTAWILRLVCRSLLPGLKPAAFVGGVGLLAVGTWLPWTVSELMPDVFTPLLALVICLLAAAPERLSATERMVLTGLAALMIASQQSSVPLAFGLTAILWLAARSLARRGGRLLALAAAPVLAIVALCSMNLAAHGRFAVSPFGNVFLLARVIYDGPGMAALRAGCPASHWRLCPFLDRFPATSDEFLWTDSSPLNLAGGPKAVSADADAIIRAALYASPRAEFRAALANTAEQLARFASGDGLQPWPAQVSPWIARDFPAREAAAYAAASQQAGTLAVPPFLACLHIVVALGGVAVCLVLLPLTLVRRTPAAGLLLAVLVTLPLSAAVTGALSTPHDRYQSRIMWLEPFAAAVSLAALFRRPDAA